MFENVNYESVGMMFLSSFSIVFLLGLQSQYVRQKLYIPSLCTSTLVGISQLFLYKVAHDSTMADNLGFLIGGVVGTVTSIPAHTFLSKFIKPKRRHK
jgi:hypothetical protein